MKIYKVEAEGDVLWIQAENLDAAKARFKEMIGDVPASMLKWNEVDSKPEDEDFL